MPVDRLLEHCNVGLGVAFNAILIYIIHRFSRLEMGTYRYLLTVFSAYDIFLSLLHGLVNPKAIVVSSTYGTVAHSYIESGHLLAFYYSCFSLSFTLLNIHFLYRYWTIRRPSKIARFSNTKFIMALFMFLAATFVLWHALAISIKAEPNDPSLPVLRASFRRTYNDTVRNGWLVMDHWRGGRFNFRTLSCLLPSFVIMQVQFTVAAYLAWGTYRGIARAELISKAHRSFQFKILLATAVPLIFVCIPWSCVMYFPLFGLPDYGISFAFPVFSSLFPAWDAIVITLLIKDYREGLLRILRLRKAKTTSIVPSTVSQMTTRWTDQTNVTFSIM